MTAALLILAALLVGFLAYRVARLPAAIRAEQSRAPLRLVDGGLPPSGHMVFAGPLEYNEHGFITTPLVPCVNPQCQCRSFNAFRQ